MQLNAGRLVAGTDTTTSVVAVDRLPASCRQALATPGASFC